jgi:integrase/recombinase XerD
MTLYATGMRRTGVSMLKVRDIESRRMMIRVERGKGGASRDLPLSPALLGPLREYWLWKLIGAGLRAQPNSKQS